jgi:hypothetical protein
MYRAGRMVMHNIGSNPPKRLENIMKETTLEIIKNLSPEKQEQLISLMLKLKAYRQLYLDPSPQETNKAQ